MKSIKNVDAQLTPQETAQLPIYLGTVWVSVGAMKALEDHADWGIIPELKGVLARHANGDHGDIDRDQARSVPGSVHSVYRAGHKFNEDKLLVTTYAREGNTFVTRA